MQYYVLEGIDTSGKTTQLNLLRERLTCVSLSDQPLMDNDIIILNEPGSTEIGRHIRKILLQNQYNLSDRTSFLLFLAQRAEIFAKIKNLPNTVISDRSLISGIAYAKNFPIDQALELNLFATQSILPHKIVFLELCENELQNRLFSKKLDSIEEQGVCYLLSIQERFKEIFSYLQRNFNYKIQTILDEKASNLCCSNKQPQILLLDAKLKKDILHQYIYNFFAF